MKKDSHGNKRERVAMLLKQAQKSYQYKRHSRNSVVEKQDKTLSPKESNDLTKFRARIQAMRNDITGDNQ